MTNDCGAPRSVSDFVIRVFLRHSSFYDVSLRATAST
jgi:hypothetical protein